MLTVVVLFTSCTPWRAEYLEEGLGHVTQDDVALKLGPPMSERTLSNGEAVWLYRYTGADVNQYGGSSWCREYVLKFDNDKVLRHWNRQKC